MICHIFPLQLPLPLSYAFPQSSEDDFQSELNLPRIRDGLRNFARVGGKNKPAWDAEICPVEEVEEFGAEFQPSGLSERTKSKALRG
jgi:hypothetical protein